MILTTVVFASPLFEKDNCMDAGGRATHGAVAEGLGEIIQINPLIPPFTKGEVNSYMITWSHTVRAGIIADHVTSRQTAVGNKAIQTGISNVQNSVEANSLALGG